MKAEVDADLCGGHSVCVGLCPEVFELHDDGYAFVKVDEVPSEHEDAVRRAVDQCPTYAISITTEEGAQ